jgi:hypothetical protein
MKPLIYDTELIDDLLKYVIKLCTPQVESPGCN